MIDKKSVPLTVALGFAASLAFAPAFASSHQGGGYEKEDRAQMQDEERQQPRAEGKERVRTRVEAIGYDVEQIDKDRNQFVTEEEYSEWRQSLFENLDADQNEELSVLEYIVLNPTRLEPKLLQARFEKLDEDDDGKVTKEQYLQKTQNVFQEIDQDNDGKVSNDELSDALLGRG
ncbi:MAG: EF-hand domain-containing protein [Alphaproteobacteria bacterium]